MGHGLPDGHLSGKTKTVYGLLDMAELAARLGSPVFWDRLGNVVIVDDFSDGLCKGIVYEAVADDLVTLQSVSSVSGPFSVLAHACGDAGNMAGMYYERGLPVQSGIGLQFSFGIHENTQYIQWTIEHNDGVKAHRGAVRYDWVDKTLEWQEDATTWVPFATGVAASEFAAPFNTGKLTVDFATDKYVRFRMNSEAYDLSPHAVYVAGTAITERLSVWGLHISQTAKVAEVYLDAFIVTQNEP